MRAITTAHMAQIVANRRRQQQLADKERTSDVARIASELQRQVPGLCRTEALKIAERAIPATL